MFKQVQKVARRLMVVTVGLLALGCLLVAWYGYGIHLTSRSLDPSLAFWMDHSWSTAPGNSFEELQSKIADYSIDELYFHIGPFTTSGQLAPDLSIPSSELATLPTVNYAWIGQLRSEINLDDPTVRAQIIKSAAWAESQGFDGVHLDIEPIRAEDSAFVDLLSELRSALPGGKISVAIDQWEPKFLADLAGAKSYWSTDEIASVTPYVDELVVMTYDTGFHNPTLYEWWVEQQTVALSQLVPDSVKVRVGIPAYDEGASIDPAAENLKTGLAGFTRGVQNVRSNLAHLAGLAVYPYWEMDDSDWQTLAP